MTDMPLLKVRSVSTARVKAITMKLRSNRSVNSSTLRWASSEKLFFFLDASRTLKLSFPDK